MCKASSELEKPLSINTCKQFCTRLFLSLLKLDFWLGKGFFIFPFLSFLIRLKAMSPDGSLSSRLLFRTFYLGFTWDW